MWGKMFDDSDITRAPSLLPFTEAMYSKGVLAKIHRWPSEMTSVNEGQLA
jgi:hypothetical protein